MKFTKKTQLFRFTKKKSEKILFEKDCNTGESLGFAGKKQPLYDFSVTNKGLFITFEGIEGCGKSTQTKMLQESLSRDGYKVLTTREPGGPSISEKIREILLDPKNNEMTVETELLLYLAARSQHTSQWIIPALRENSIVICDRYFDSTIAYQGVGRDIHIPTLQRINHFATHDLLPDITFILDIPVDVSQERLKDKKLDRIESESVNFHEKIRQAFFDISKTHARYVFIDAAGEIDQIHNEIYTKVLNKL